MIVRQSPRTSALARALHGEAASWGPMEYLVALLVDATQLGNWQRGGGRGPKPKPVPRPRPSDVNVTRFGSGALPIDEFEAWLKEKEVA